MLKIKAFISGIFLYTIALLPFISLFWEQEIGFLKVNWILYPLVLFSLFFTITIRNRISTLFIFFTFICILYLIKALVSGVSPENILRVFVSLVPLFFIDSIAELQHRSGRKKIIIIYSFAIVPSIVYGILQYKGVIPFTEFDVVDGGVIGRVTAGYDKPNNFAAFIFPLYLLSFIVFRSNKLIGSMLIFFILFLVYITGLRTIVAVYLIILIGYFFKRTLTVFIFNYFRYLFNLIVGVCFITVIFFVYKTYGMVDAVRGRMLTWEGHTLEFFNSGYFTILFGKGHSTLGDDYSVDWYKGSLAEPHNNTLRIIVIFGFVGFLIYSLLIRHFVMKTFKRTSLPLNRFFISASFLFIMLYSVTNEPLFYPSIFWVVLFGVFFPPLEENLEDGNNASLAAEKRVEYSK